jgi:copper chaperone CopZ
MTTETIIIEGMHCDACERTITRALAKAGASVESISYTKGRATIAHNGIDRRELQRVLQSKGYDLKQEEKTPEGRAGRKRKSVSLSESTVETAILTNGFLTLVILLIVQTLLIVGIYARFPGYQQKYFLPLFYLPVVIVTNMVALWHQRAYVKSVSCMTGMMVGMTIGMMTGFGVGAIVGLTNGMFLGSVIGVGIGMFAGIYAGWCCGTMGIMEGMMAGLMSGTMGAMITVMMVLDHVELFLPLLIIIDTIILAGMMRMTVEENADADVETKPWPMSAVLAVSFIAMLAISALIVLLPKGLY